MENSSAMTERTPLTANDATPVSRSSAIRLGALEICPRTRSVFVEGQFTELGGRAFDLLMALLDAEGAIVPKEDLLDHVWPNVTVVENNLKVQLSRLRRALGPERWRIKTVAGRGYLLVAHDAWAATENLPRSLPAQMSERSLVIVVDGTPGAQERVIQALRGVAKRLDAPRMALYSENAEERVFALGG